MRKFISILVCVILLNGLVFANGSKEGPEVGIKTIEFWHTVTPIDGVDIVQDFVNDYNQKNLGIHVNATLVSWEDLRKTIIPALRSGEGPDIFVYTPGPGYIGLLGEAGLVVNLNELDSEYGWTKILPIWQINQTKVNGNLYGIAAAENLLGVYYNKKIYSDLGLNIPSTYEEFVDNCRIIKEETDIVPLALDTKDQWPSFHQSTAFYTSFVGADRFNEVTATGKGFDDSDLVSAIDALVQLYKKGYTTAQPNALSNNDAHVEFEAGEVAMRLTGSWAINEFSSKMGDNVGFFILPPANGLDYNLSGNVSDLVTVSSTAQNKEETMQFMDAMVRYTPLWSGTFGIPVQKGLAREDFENGLSYDAYKGLQAASGVSTTIDTVMSQEFNNTFKNEYQKLFADKITPLEFSKEIQSVLK